MAFKKGISGNPLGRPPGRLNKVKAEIKELLGDNVDYLKVVKKLEQRALKGSERAAQILLEFRFGKPAGQDELLIQQRRVDEREIGLMAEATLKELSTRELVDQIQKSLRLSNLGVKPASTPG